MDPSRDDRIASVFDSLVESSNSARACHSRGSIADSLYLLQEIRRKAEFLEHQLLPFEHEHLHGDQRPGTQSAPLPHAHHGVAPAPHNRASTFPYPSQHQHGHPNAPQALYRGHAGAVQQHGSGSALAQPPMAAPASGPPTAGTMRYSMQQGVPYGESYHPSQQRAHPHQYNQSGPLQEDPGSSLDPLVPKLRSQPGQHPGTHPHSHPQGPHELHPVPFPTSHPVPFAGPFTQRGSAGTLSESIHPLHPRQRQNSLPHILDPRSPSQQPTHLAENPSRYHVPPSPPPFQHSALVRSREGVHQSPMHHAGGQYQEQAPHPHPFQQPQYPTHPHPNPQEHATHEPITVPSRRASQSQVQHQANQQSKISALLNQDLPTKPSPTNAPLSTAPTLSRTGAGSRSMSLGNIHVSSAAPSLSIPPAMATSSSTRISAVTKPSSASGSRSESGGSRTQFHAPLEPEVISKLDELFFRFLQRICSDLNVCDSKGDHIHQPLMAKKMQRLDTSTDFRPFKFRIQAFTNAFHESLVQQGLTEDILPLRKVKVYLWKHRYISRFNEDGKKQKSKGNHVWNIEARKVVDGPSSSATAAKGDATGSLLFHWEFREYSSRIAGQIIKFARVGIPYVYAPRIWDAQMSCPVAEYSSPWLPPWLKWQQGELRGVPGPEDESCTITVIAKYVREGDPCHLELTFPLTVSDPLKEGELLDSPYEDEDELEDDQDEDDEIEAEASGGHDQESSGDEDDYEEEDEDEGESFSVESRNVSSRKQPRERRHLARAKERQESKRRKQTR